MLADYDVTIEKQEQRNKDRAESGGSRECCENDDENEFRKRIRSEKV